MKTAEQLYEEMKVLPVEEQTGGSKNLVNICKPCRKRQAYRQASRTF